MTPLWKGLSTTIILKYSGLLCTMELLPVHVGMALSMPVVM